MVPNRHRPVDGVFQLRLQVERTSVGALRMFAGAGSQHEVGWPLCRESIVRETAANATSSILEENEKIGRDH